MMSRFVAVPFLAAAALLIGAVAALAVVDLQFSYSVSPTKVGAVASSKASATIANADIAPATDARFHLAPGTLVAHADDGTSPVSPPPLNGDRVGSAVITADPIADFRCGNPVNVNANASWVEPISATAPAGTVGQVRVEGSYLTVSFSSEAFIVQSPGDVLQPSPHYEMVLTGLNSDLPALCAGSSVAFTVNTFGYAQSSSGARTKRVTQKNPSTVGTKTVFADYNDVNGVNHTGSATYEITRR